MDQMIDQELLSLRAEVERLEHQINGLFIQKATLEKLIQKYNHEFYLAVGDLLLKVNKLRIERLKDESKVNPGKQQEYSNAQKEYDEFDTQYKKSISTEIPSLSQEGQKILKSNFRKASFLCHPDSVADDFKEEASRLFNELKNAYDSNNVAKVSSILEHLKNNKFPKKSDTITDKDRLKFTVNHHRAEVQKLKLEIGLIKGSEIYQHIISIGNWEVYFSHIKKQLEIEVARLG
jgi:hypothetical protein